jgi:hypothetical protein
MIGQPLAQPLPKMPARQLDLAIEPARASSHAADIVLLARAADAKGTTRADFLRDLAAIASEAEAQLMALTAAGLINDSAGRVSLTALGRDQLLAALGLKALPKDWAEMRTHLVAHALGLKLAKPEGLRAAILDQAFDLKLKGAMTNARLRSALAVVALERAFGNKVKAGLGTGAGLSPKAGRVLAGQLAKAPKDYGTDSRLVAALAAEHGGAVSAEFEALRNALIARLAGNTPAVAPKTAKAKPAANDAAPPLMPVAPVTVLPVAPEMLSRPAASNRPDLAGFADAVKAIAKLRGEGWSGSRKSYIADVWEDVKSRFTSWGLTEVEFKGMLAEAHRTGHVVLANADLKTKDNAARLAASAIVYKNTVWHFVRVED